MGFLHWQGSMQVKPAQTQNGQRFCWIFEMQDYFDLAWMVIIGHFSGWLKEFLLWEATAWVHAGIGLALHAYGRAVRQCTARFSFYYVTVAWQTSEVRLVSAWHLPTQTLVSTSESVKVQPLAGLRYKIPTAWTASKVMIYSNQEKAGI